MKPHTLFLTLGILLLGFSACEPLNETPETPAFSLNLTSPDGEPSTDNDNAVLQKLVYHLFIFRSNTANPSPIMTAPITLFGGIPESHPKANPGIHFIHPQ